MPKLIDITIVSGKYVIDTSSWNEDTIGLAKRYYNYPLQVLDPNDTIDDPNNPGAQIQNPAAAMIDNPDDLVVWLIKTFISPVFKQALLTQLENETIAAAKVAAAVEAADTKNTIEGMN